VGETWTIGGSPSESTGGALGRQREESLEVNGQEYFGDNVAGGRRWKPTEG